MYTKIARAQKHHVHLVVWLYASILKNIKTFSVTCLLFCVSLSRNGILQADIFPAGTGKEQKNHVLLKYVCIQTLHLADVSLVAIYCLEK